MQKNGKDYTLASLFELRLETTGSQVSGDRKYCIYIKFGFNVAYVKVVERRLEVGLVG